METPHLPSVAEKRILQSLEIRAIATLSGIFSLRMLGLFMILPVFAIYAPKLQGVTPTLIGVALGIYGFTQAIFQIPFGYLSDRFGRKPLVMMGLLIFSLGSMVAAMSDSIYGVIMGRSLQGAGAVGSVILALLTDLTREEIRLKAMAAIGITIGVSFGLAFILGPLFSAQWGIKGLFWITAMLGVLGIWVLIQFVPNPIRPIYPVDDKNNPDNQNSLDNQSNQSNQNNLINQKNQNNLNNLSNLNQSTVQGSLAKKYHIFFGVLVLHASLTALFLIIPNMIMAIQLKEQVSNTLTEVVSNTEIKSWQFYLPVLLGSFIVTVPILLLLEKNKDFRFAMAGLVTLLLLSEILLYGFHNTAFGLAISLGLFFVAFNCLEASLPAKLSKLAPISQRGKVFGIFSTLQFLGLFIGGVLGGMLNTIGSEVAVIGFCVILALIWLGWLLSFTIKRGI